MIDSTVRLTGNGYTVALTDTAEGLHRQPGGGGWGMAPVVNAWFEGAGDGDDLRGTRRVRRELRIPLMALGNTRAEVETELRKLVRVIRTPFRIHVDYATGGSFWIDAVYDSGLDGVYSMSPEKFNEATLVFKCPDPYWTSDESQSFVIAPAPADAPFLPELAGLHVASAAAFGTVSVTNVGDVESRPTWIVHGPGTDLSIAINGVGLDLDMILGATDIVTIQYVNNGWTITDQTGENLYPFLQPAPVFPVLPPGGSTVTVTMGDTGVETYIQCIYPERREVVY